MKILAFETSAKAASVAMAEDGRLLAESYCNSGVTHSQTLLTMAEGLIASCGKPDAVAVAAGPGSFTGVRIGVAAAKGYAWGAELPCYGVSTLEAMACWLGIPQGWVCACMDARRSQVYNALFQAEEGKLHRRTEDRAISLEELKKELLALDGPIFLVGDGSNLCYNTLREEVPGLILPPEHRMHQRSSGVAVLAAREISQGRAGDAASLVPNYLRLSQAEREKMERQKKL